MMANEIIFNKNFLKWYGKAPYLKKDRECGEDYHVSWLSNDEKEDDSIKTPPIPGEVLKKSVILDSGDILSYANITNEQYGIFHIDENGYVFKWSNHEHNDLESYKEVWKRKALTALLLLCFSDGGVVIKETHRTIRKIRVQPKLYPEDSGIREDLWISPSIILEWNEDRYSIKLFKEFDDDYDEYDTGIEIKNLNSKEVMRLFHDQNASREGWRLLWFIHDRINIICDGKEDDMWFIKQV